MKRDIYKDEWYPVFCVGEDECEGGVEFPDGLYERYLAVVGQFDAVQKELIALGRSVGKKW